MKQLDKANIYEIQHHELSVQCWPSSHHMHDLGIPIFTELSIWST